MKIPNKTSIELAILAEEYQRAFDTLNEQIRNANKKPHIIVTNDWKIEMAVAIALVRSTNSKVCNLDIADGELRSGLLRMAQLYEQAMLAISSGIDAKSFVLVMSASTKIKEGNAVLGKCIALLRS